MFCCLVYLGSASLLQQWTTLHTWIYRTPSHTCMQRTSFYIRIQKAYYYTHVCREYFPYTNTGNTCPYIYTENTFLNHYVVWEGIWRTESTSTCFHWEVCLWLRRFARFDGPISSDFQRYSFLRAVSYRTKKNHYWHFILSNFCSKLVSLLEVGVGVGDHSALPRTNYITCPKFSPIYIHPCNNQMCPETTVNLYCSVGERNPHWRVVKSQRNRHLLGSV